MRIHYLVCLVFLGFQSSILYSQDSYLLKGQVLDNQSKQPLTEVLIKVEESQIATETDENGSFSFIIENKNNCIIFIQKPSYRIKRIPILLEKDSIDLGIIYLELDIEIEQTDNLISLTDAELFDDEISSGSSGLLQATKDIYLTKAAFDFGQAFFKVRGYDSQNGKVLINGITMNKFYDGRPQWNNFGGLNDVTRNQQFSNGLEASTQAFGGILGVTNIDTRPSKMRPGIRVSTSASNRTYGGRLMATYTSSLEKSGLIYSVSASRRWSEEGYVDGTLYDAFSFFGSAEYKINSKNSFVLTGIMASNRRGRSSAVTEEVFQLLGNTYNPYWGKQDGEIRNSRERKIAEPIVMANYYYEAENLKIQTGFAYQTGINSRSRLGYYNAPNPDPTYYRYLPSFYINSPIGANFLSANQAKDGFLENPQLNWNTIYTANKREKAAYVLYDDVAKDQQLSINTTGNISFNQALSLDLGFSYRNLKSRNYAIINDLFGADYHEDIDVFSNTLNNVDGDIVKKEDDIFNYNYTFYASELDAFIQLKVLKKRWNAFLAVNYSIVNYQRNGIYNNERFLENSKGKSEKINFSGLGLKSGLLYKINGRNWVSVNAAYIKKAPILQNVFINPRENNQIVPDLKLENIQTFDASYIVRLPKLVGRLTGFHTLFKNTTDVNFFFVDTGVGSDFVQEVLTDLDKKHLGVELGLEYELSSSFKLTGAAGIGKYVYANNPNVVINFDTAGAEEDLINLEGNLDLGQAKIKNYKLAQGPQQAFALGINYRDPKYWWVGLTANYLENNYANISTITRTDSFYFDPETGGRFPDATEENVSKLLLQKPLDNFYLLNLVGGKSWLKKGKYISAFVSINNVFDTKYRSGGYEQSRNGNYGQLKQDNLSGTPSFGTKYWYGYGRTYFLNLAISF